ncbi:histone-fold-containing protein [Meira miltonrushii]|uniref:Histone-fold-containing protein n=1 Tax=Meira miltonrushii TaxID=1280837 RepID=A0A316VLK7_9BASI|nr:histone-fold-containing protein [Meira miltonrushii]PWN36971.1 histone-fold-containing protein [Meira miltonrushii]
MSGSQQQRPESPPYVTSDMHQDMEAYQRNFWTRQMARVEEQVSLPEDQAAAVASATGKRAKKRDDDDEEEEDDEAGEPMSDAAIAASAKELMELFKPQAGQLPLARIKKVMKASDDDVKMISAEAPILFARACEIFIADLTCRSYMHATANKRRTVQRSDVVAAVAGSNLFDFLVDIVPRSEEAGGSGGRASSAKKESAKNTDEEAEDGMEE